MVSKYFLLFLIPALVECRISVKITAATSEAEAEVEYSGENVEIISDRERETFDIGDRSLKRAVEKFADAAPTDVYVRSPTPWNDVYKTYKWEQVKRILKPIRTRILGVHTKPVIVATREFENHSGVKAKYNAAIKQEIQETVSNTWSVGGELTVGQEIEYSVNFAAGSAGGKTSLSYAASWGNDTTKEKSATLGSSTGVEVELEPGQAVVASLTATQGTLDLEVEYEARLEGVVFANYRNKYRDHYFWAFPVSSVQLAGGLPRTVSSTEKISIGFYTSARVDIKDKVTTGRIKQAPAGFV
ncbi:spherulin-2A-like [Spodoptera litura]|uniref:Spherulin-2A-like n=1 Tax=Spodoptera litura TaxID=69820 RepID=A0A9J7IU94_SPOLT|nr:spherulin-2A-like [Spodoptera litura]